MTSRERVICALNHEEADRVPIDFGAMRSTGISAIAYNKLRKYLGISEGKTKMYDVLQQLADPEEKICKLFHTDVVQLHRREPSWCSIEKWKDGVLPDGSECLVPETFDPVCDEKGNWRIYRGGVAVGLRLKNSLYFDYAYHPAENMETFDEIDTLPMPYITDDELVYLREQAKKLRESTDKAILGAFGGSIFEAGTQDFTHMSYFANLIENPELIHYYNEKRTTAWLDNLSRYLMAVGEYIDVIQFCDDLGTQIDMQISPKMYREMLKPYHSRLYQYVRNNYPSVRVFLHSCGAITKVIPDLIDAGVQILNPVQLTARDMNPVMLKREYGKELTFWGGGCNTSTTATNGSPLDVDNEVHELINIFAPGGGFIFTQVHNIQANVPPENIVAIYKAADKYGKYPLN